MKLLCIGVLTVFLLSGQKEPSLVETQYDKFRDETVVKIADGITLDSVMVSIQFSYAGTAAPESIEEFRVLFIAPSGYWLGSPSEQLVYVLLNDQSPADKLFLKHAGAFNMAGRTWRSFGITLPRDTVRSWACAKSVEVKIGTEEHSLTSRDRAALRELLTASKNSCPK